MFTRNTHPPSTHTPSSKYSSHSPSGHMERGSGHTPESHETFGGGSGVGGDGAVSYSYVASPKRKSESTVASSEGSETTTLRASHARTKRVQIATHILMATPLSDAERC